ncbi:MAG: urea amidolyase associated protein UAAP1 [Pseudomonadales bacterium]|jgi:urea carboxylase-associated protein 2|nr:urea amidolyase associated protein UAAP1 [Pseudomonadales bacterium]
MNETSSAPGLGPAVLEETLPAGCHFSLVVRRGYTLRLTDLKGGANVGLLVFNQDEKSERYNMADTLKAQHVSRLAQSLVLYSDMGRVMMSMTHDDCGWHDTICGTTDAAMIAAQYGELDFQTARNDYRRNGRDGFLHELGRWGLSRRDLVANVNLFSRVVVEDDGSMVFVEDNSPPGSTVDLRAELNCLVVMTSAPHPLAPGSTYPTGEVALSVHWTGPAAADDPCRHSRPENERGFRNSEAWFAQPAGGIRA